MPRVRTTLLKTLALAALAGAAACGGHPAPSSAGCETDEQCSSDARCTRGACVANSRPLAAFAITGDLAANALVRLDGSASRDPDEDDAIAAYAWSLEADGAPCAAPEVASTGPTALVRFGCAGRFLARLVVVDGMQVRSTPASQVVVVAAGSGSAAVVAGPDQAVGHACAGSPVTCRLAARVQLAAAAAAAPAGATFHWTAQPPDGLPLDAGRRVRFVPDAAAQSPSVEIETDGTAISGDWLLRVEVRDGVGAIGADVVRLSVANRAPAIVATAPGPFDHAYVRESRLFTAAGTIPVAVVDADGDPVQRQVAVHHAGDGAAVFEAEDLGDAVRFVVAVPFGEPADVLRLLGGEGLERSITFTASDVNGASATTTLPVVIRNRPPVWLAGPSPGPLHRFEPATQRYLADVRLGTWRDPDGDPLALSVSGDGECTAWALDPEGGAWARCARPFAGVASLAGFLRDRAVAYALADPWSSQSSRASFRISNRAPVTADSVSRPAVECRPRGGSDIICPGSGSGSEHTNLFPAASVLLAAATSDPDGDPLDVRPLVPGTGGACLPGQPCALTLFLPAAESCSSFPPGLEASFAATDGVATSQAVIKVAPTCR